MGEIRLNITYTACQRGSIDGYLMRIADRSGVLTECWFMSLESAERTAQKYLDRRKAILRPISRCNKSNRVLLREG